MNENYHRGKNRRDRERLIRSGFFIIALASIVTLGLIVAFLFMEGVPIFSKVTVKEFVFGRYWYPTDDPADFGIFPLIVASLAVTFISSVISIPLGVFSALFLAENVKSRVERATETTEFLAQEAKRLKGDLEKIESLVAEYKQENANALPEHLNLKMQMLERTQRTLADLDRDFKAKEVELSRLELELETEKSGSSGGGSDQDHPLRHLRQESVHSWLPPSAPVCEMEYREDWRRSNQIQILLGLGDCPGYIQSDRTGEIG